MSKAKYGIRIGIAAALCAATAGATTAQQARAGASAQGSVAGGATVEAEGAPSSRLAFPRGVQDFEDLDCGRPASFIQGWEQDSVDASAFSARAANDVLGRITSVPGSQRWVRVRDTSRAHAASFLASAPVVAPSAWNYAWHLRFLVEELGTGPAFPVLAGQHATSGGYRTMFGVELAADGAYLVVRGIGGDPTRALLAGWSGATAHGKWIDLELAVDFDRGLVSARLGGGAPVRLALSPRRGTHLESLRFAYQAGGLGNTGTVLVDDLGIAFGSAVCEQTFVVGFETEDDFSTALANGQSLSTPPEFGSLFAISGAGANLGPAIFDTTPGGPNDPSQDRDLLVGLGNAVILQNDQAPTQTVPGFFDRPNDDQDGGTVTFAFTRPLEVLALDLADIDQGAVQSSLVTLTDTFGRTRVYSVPAGWTEDLLINGPTGVRTLETTTLLAQPGFTSVATAVEDAGYDPQNVVFLAVRFGSSGALDNLELRLPCVRIDFETEDDGTTPLVNGQDISTPPEFGVQVSISDAGPNAGAAIFDSTPGGPNDPSQDLDLLVGLGNILILQNDNAAPSLVQTVPGIFDRPNDDSDGGAIVFTFATPGTARRVDLADIDPGQPNGSTVVATDTGGRTRTFVVPAGWTEDLPTHGGSGFRTLDLLSLAAQPGFAANATAFEDAGFDETRVVSLRVNLGSSGGVDNLCFCPCGCR